MTTRVTRFLVSGTDTQLVGFHLRVCMLLNGIERHGQTIYYTCMREDRDIALAAARETGVTMQEMDDGTTEHETWAVIVQGDHPGWHPAARAAGGRQ